MSRTRRRRTTIERFELLHLAIPLVTPFRTSFGTADSKETFLLHVVTDEAEGWAEFGGDPDPLYCYEFVAGAEAAHRHPGVPGRIHPQRTGRRHRHRLGRAPNLALAALPGFTLPGDTSASSRYFAEDITEPFALEDGCLRVPSGPGIGIDPCGTRCRASPPPPASCRPRSGRSRSPGWPDTLRLSPPCSPPRR